MIGQPRQIDEISIGQVLQHETAGKAYLPAEIWRVIGLELFWMIPAIVMS